MKRTFALLTFLCGLAFQIHAQQQPTPIFVGDDAPVWMQLMMADQPNVHTIQQAYKDYYEDHGFTKNRYTQYYKRWMQWARTYMQADGSLRFPTATEQAAFEKQVAALRAENGTAEKAPPPAAWTFVGPKRTYDTDGTTEVTWQTNIYALDVSLSNPSILYAGGEGGGLWKTTNKGVSWVLKTQNVLHGSIGAVKIHPTNSNIVFFGTGGKIVKSTDGGTTWATVYTENNLWVNEFAMSIANPNIILAASDQGLLRSIDGGTSWAKLFTNQTWTVKHKPGDPNTVYAGRKNGSGSDFMRSTDGGTTWAASNTGWWTPSAGLSVGGVIIAVCPSEPNRLYAYLCGNGGSLYGYVGVFVSTNGGTSWANTHPTGAVGNSPTAYTIPNHTNLMAHDGTTGFDQGFYDMAIIVNPANSSQLIAGGTSWFKSNNGGATWTALGSYVGGLSWSHPDMQALVANGTDLWIATDGGLNYSNDWATTIQARMNGISGSDMWGFDSGWNEDVLVGGRYHNGNMAWFERWPAGKFYRMGGAEAATGYVNQGQPRKVYHSDIGGHLINGAFTAGVSSFAVGAFPNESYAYYANSEMEWHPNFWNTVFLGKDQKIWKSTDGGTSFTVLYTFPGAADKTVFDIEISRSNSQIMYCSQWDGTDDKIWRSTNGGTSWTACTALPLPNNNDRVKMALSESNPNELWVAVTYGSNGKKVYKTTNGGTTWTNLTTATLNNITVSNIMAQYGTNGGVYIGTNAGVFYRNNTHADWQPYATGLPISAETNKLKPFYKTGKIRNGCWGFGVWESPLFETGTPQAVAMSSAQFVGCQRDTVYFDDHSAVNHTGATWAWQLPGAAWASSLTIRNPKAQYASPGNYNAIMALTYNGITTYDTLSLTVGSLCAADSIPGKGVTMGGNANPGSVVIPPLKVNTNTFSVTAWVKLDTIQPEYSSIFMYDELGAGLHFQPGNNRLGYHWPGGAWWWDSGLTVPIGEWSHVALVVTPTAVTIYLNGKSATHSGLTLDKVNFTGTSQLGSYHSWGSRYMKGAIDEVCIYSRSLTQKEIREKMHLRKIPTNEAGMLAYYQFNETAGNAVYDRAKTKHASLSGSAARINSTIALGPGKSYSRTISVGGSQSFTSATGFMPIFPTTGTYPNGEVVATRINLTPDQNPTADPVSRSYWVVRNYGTNANFTQLTSLRLNDLGNVPSTTTANQYKLYRRNANGEGATWSFLDLGDTRYSGADGDLLFAAGNNVTSFGQFIVTKPVSGPSDQAQVLEERNPVGTQKSEPLVSFSPNPAISGSELTLETDLTGICSFKLYDEKGRAIKVMKFEGTVRFSLQGVATGAYFYRIENEQYMKTGVLVVQ